MNIQNSRVITYPSTVDKSNNHTVLLIDANEGEIENIVLFCKVSNQNYDIYLYRNEIDDLHWLSHISQNIDHTLISSTSKITAPGDPTIFGAGQTLLSPLEYFQQYDDANVVNTHLNFKEETN